MSTSSTTHVSNTRAWVRKLIHPERKFIKLAIVYGIAISLLTLAIPIAVQTLINTVVNIASVSAVVTLSLILLTTLILSGVLSAFRTYVMEKYERHIYARLTAEISVRTLMTNHAYFAGRRNVDIPNRYFDITTYQKNIPPLLIDGFALLLQLAVGFTLVSFYHPFFLLYCILLIVVLYIIWRAWAKQAIIASVELSHAKYATAKWLGDMASAHSFFRSGRHIEYAQTKTENVTASYIKAHRQFFRFSFSQIVALLLFYAVASSTLLGLGGYLVIIGELSIGQLVAAELILTAIFFGLSKAGNYLKMYYELCGAADELSLIFKMPINTDMTLEQRSIPVDSELQFRQLQLSSTNSQYNLDFTIGSGKKVFILTSKAWIQGEILSILKNQKSPVRGSVRLGGQDIRDYKHQQLNNPPVSIINKAPIVECTIFEFMKLSAPNVNLTTVQDALDKVGLGNTIYGFDKGLDTELSPLGSPLQPHEFLLLKLASALLVKPKLLVLTQYFDNLPKEHSKNLLKMLEQQTFTVMYFSNYMEAEVFDYCMNLDWLEKTS